jgi:anti-sigma factor ChrR (cupin superfamily)
MDINADFTARALVHADALDWTPSPMAGVDRRMLDRIGDEVARATSLVRYAPKSHFSAHTHGGGEEFVVLEGVFKDEHGDYPAGTYVRNPPTSSHTPGSEAGCVIFVKLWQFDPDDRVHVRVAMDDPTPVPIGSGGAAAVLFEDGRETVRMETWEPEARIARHLPGGGEFLVLDGGFTEGGETLRRLSWLRLPPGGQFDVVAGPDGAKVWSKTGHLLDVRAPTV